MANWSGLWNGRYNENYAGLGTNTSELNGPELQDLARSLRPRGMQKVRALLNALIGAAPGATATVASRRLVYDDGRGQPLHNGGVVTPQLVTDMNRVTTTADANLLKGAIATSRAPTYPVDKSGNGGGGKSGSAY